MTATSTSRLAVDTAVDDFITKLAKELGFSLEQAVKAVLESTTITTVLTKSVSSVGLVKQKSNPVKERQLANASAVDESVAQLSCEQFVAKLADALEQLTECNSLEEAVDDTGSTMLKWLRDLPADDKALDVGLQYSEAMSRTMFFRLQEKAVQLLGSALPRFKSEHEALLIETRTKVTKSIEKRLKTVESPHNVREEAEKLMVTFSERFSLTATTEWVHVLYSKKLPVSQCVEFLIALFIYSVDLKWCDCRTNTEFKDFKENEKRMTKPERPVCSRVHGYNSAPWAVANWVNRIKGGDSSLLPHEQSLLLCTLQLMEPFITMLDRALDCLPPVGMRAVFRGVPVRLAHQFGIDDEFVMEPHTSTSLEGEEALTFMDPKKPGTFFILRLHSAAMIDFMSAYPHQAEALLAMHSRFRVSSKLSRTVLRMLGCRFDVVTLVEGGSNATNTELIEFLRRCAQQTQFIYREYLESMIPVRLCHPTTTTDDHDHQSVAENELLVSKVNELIQESAKKKEHRHVLMTGDAGCGKTSATLAAYSHLGQQEGCYATMIPLPSVKDFGSDGDVDTAVLEALDINSECFIELCKSTDVFIFLDSLDEIGHTTTSMLEKGILPRNKLLAHAASVIVSCRSELFDMHGIKEQHVVLVGPTTGRRRSSQTVDVWHIAPFSDGDSLEMIRRYAMRGDGSVSEAKLLEHANCAPKELQRHPLYMKMILQIPVGTLKPGTKRNDVYQHFIDTMVNEACGGDKRNHAEMINSLQQLALGEMLLKEQWQITVGTAKRILGCTGSDLEVLPFRVDDPHDNNSQISFLHRSQGEYLAAVELAKQPQQISQLTETVSATAKRGTLHFLLEVSDDENVRSAAIDCLLLSCGDGASLISTLKEDLRRKEAEAHDGADRDVAIATALLNLGMAHRAKGDTDVFLEMSERALKLKERHFGPDHIEVANALSNLAIAYFDEGDNARYLELSERALKLKEKHYGPDHIEVAASLGNLGIAYGECGDTSKDLELTERALRIQEEHHGPDHVIVAGTLSNLGATYGRLGNNIKKLEFTERALKLKEKHYGPDHIQLVDTLTNLSSAHDAMYDSENQLRCLERALSIKERHYGSNHIELASTLMHLSEAHTTIHEHSKALEAVDRAITLAETNLGHDDETTLGIVEYTGLRRAKAAKRKDKVDEYKRWIADR